MRSYVVQLSPCLPRGIGAATDAPADIGAGSVDGPGTGRPVGRLLKVLGVAFGLAVVVGNTIGMGIYLALNVTFLRVIPIAEMAGDPFVAATAAARIFGPNGDTVIRLLMIGSLVAAVNALQLMAARVPFAMARDNLLPAALTRVNAGGTPVTALAVGTLNALGFIATNTFDSVVALLAFFFVANYALSFTCVFVQRHRDPDTPRPFRVPGYPWVPAIALAGSVAFLVAAVIGDRTNSVRALIMIALSLPAYLLVRKLAPIRAPRD